MTRSERDAVRAAFQFRCGYCGVEETQAGSELTIDHYRPTARDGLDEAENWVYCCHACNTFKGAYWSQVENLRLLHPLRDDFSAHLSEENGLLIGLTTRGRLHIERMHLNRPALVAHRLDEVRTRGLEREIELTREILRQEKERSARLENQIQELL